jgi:hypothetical protein
VKHPKLCATAPTAGNWASVLLRLHARRSLTANEKRARDGESKRGDASIGHILLFVDCSHEPTELFDWHETIAA